MIATPEELYVVHLDDEHKQDGTFQEAFTCLCAGIEKFFKDKFTASYNVRYQSYGSIEELRDNIFQQHPGELSHIGQRICLFAFDYFLDSSVTNASPIQEEEELANIKFGDGTPFEKWINVLFPHIPVILLTKGGDGEVNHIDNWKYFSKGYLNRPSNFCQRISTCFDSWWKPHFSNALDVYTSSINSGVHKNAISWHTPGHNAGNAFFYSPLLKEMHRSYGDKIFKTDLSVSVEHLGDLSEPDQESPLKSAQDISARIFGTEDTFFITNGTSTSNKAMLMALLKPGEKVLLDRNCHKSIHQAVVMAGAHPVYLKPEFNNTLGVWSPIDIKTLKDKEKEFSGDNKKPRMLILTTCTYEGIIYPVSDIARWCQYHGILFYADEAWAPYLRFHPSYVMQHENGDWKRINAVDGGADFVAHSTHKALSAFSQASMIHITKSFKAKLDNLEDDPDWQWLKDRFSAEDFGTNNNPIRSEDMGDLRYKKFKHNLFETLRYWHSTSPHYPMLATLDCAGIQARVEGSRILEERIGWVREFRKSVDAFCDGDHCVLTKDDIVGRNRSGNYKDYIQDPLKIVIGIKTPGHAVKLKDKLQRDGIAWEKSTKACIQFLVTPGTQRHHIEDLQNVLRQNKECLGIPTSCLSKIDLKASDLVVLPRDAALSTGKLVLLDESIHQVGAQLLVPYPPGIPVILPGVKITESDIEIIKNSANEDPHSVHGLSIEGNRFFVKIMTKKEVDKYALNDGI